MSEKAVPMTQVTVKYFNPNKPEDGEQTYTKVLATRDDDPDFELMLLRNHRTAFEGKGMINISVALSDYPEQSEPEKEDDKASDGNNSLQDK